jgi:hypothetical protein
MNLGYVISTIIASLVLLSLIALNSRIIRGSGEQTLYTMAKIESDLIVDYVKDDMRSMGYGVDSTAITIADPNRIQFLVHFEGAPDRRVIDWFFDDLEEPSGRNPNTRPLYRRDVPGAADPGFDPDEFTVETIGSGVVQFQLAYLNSRREVIGTPGDPVPDAQLGEICQIRLELIVESLDSYDLNRFERSIWSGEITPFNLNCSAAP